MIFIAGATGFAGGHLVDDLLSKGLKPRCLVRSEGKAKTLQARGIETVRGDITEPESLRGALKSGDFVVHLVGIIEERGGSTFRKIHVEGTANLVSEAKRAGAGHFFYQSALGADRNSWAGYLKTKAEAEEIVKESGLDFTIFRPSLIIGPWDGFTKKIVELARLSPVLPIPGDGKTKFQPIYVKDWLKCIEKVIENPPAFRGIYEIGGPEHLTYRAIVSAMAALLGHKRPSISIPMGFMKLSAALLGTVLPSPPVTYEQLRLLEQDNICELDAVEKVFGFKPVELETALKGFLKSRQNN